MRRARSAVFLLALSAAGCASQGADVGEQLRRIQEQEAAEQRERAAAGVPKGEGLRESQLSRLESEVRRASDRVKAAQQGSDAQELAAANMALDRASQRLEAEKERQRKLEELRARTPNRRIEFGDEAGAPRPVASRPAVAMAPTVSPTAANAPASRPDSQPASQPASRPAGPDDEEFTRLSDRVRWLADLRQSGGDHAGATRLRRDLNKISIDYKTKNPAAALEALRKLEREGDR